MEIATIFRENIYEYSKKYSNLYIPANFNAVNSIIKCRTSELGGEVYYCPNCEKEHYVYHSCKNRHCPKCGSEDSYKWLEKQLEKLLPVDYFLVTFTLPEELRFICSNNKKLFYNALFSASSEALTQMMTSRIHAKGKTGFTGVLHTWTRDMLYHPHIHYIVPGGVFDVDNNEWHKSSSKFLIPVLALSKIFRAKYRDYLEKQNKELFNLIDQDVWKREFVTHSQGVGKGDTALTYLSKYVFKTAITNKRIVAYDKKQVTISYKPSGSDQQKYKKFEVLEFIRRFLDHVLPEGLKRIRSFGFLNPRSAKTFEKLKKHFEDKDQPIYLVKSENPVYHKRERNICPHCDFTMNMIKEIPRRSRSPSSKSLFSLLLG